MHKHNYLFLIAWVDGSDTAVDVADETLETDEQGNDTVSMGATNIHSQEDLLSEFKKGNENVFAVLIKFVHHLAGADLGEMAAALGYKEAFFHDYTAHDSVSVCISPKDIKGIDLDAVGAIKTIEV